MMKVDDHYGYDDERSHASYHVQERTVRRQKRVENSASIFLEE